MENLLSFYAGEQNIPWGSIRELLSPWVQSMSKTEQNPIYHAEGDVWTHTMMVLDESGAFIGGSMLMVGAFRAYADSRRLPQ